MRFSSQQYVVYATCFCYCMHLGMNRSRHLSSLPPVQTFSYLHLGFKLQAFSYDIPSFPDYSFSVLEYLPLALTDILQENGTGCQPNLIPFLQNSSQVRSINGERLLKVKRTFLLKLKNGNAQGIENSSRFGGAQ